MGGIEGGRGDERAKEAGTEGWGLREGWSAGMWKGRKRKDEGVRERRRDEKRGRGTRKLAGRQRIAEKGRDSEEGN